MAELSDEFYQSLDLDDPAILPFLSQILEDLWELGSMPAYMIELATKHIPQNLLKKVLDLGCGKGAVLIQLRQHLVFEGLGIDLMPAFIKSAKNYAHQWNCADSIRFEQGDIRTAVNTCRNYDLLIYGHDAEILGDIPTSIEKLKACISNQGWILFEAMFARSSQGHRTFLSQITKSGLQPIEFCYWGQEDLGKMNASNTESIRKQIELLIKSYPDKHVLFRNYLDKQIQECQELENDWQCVTVLLRKE